MHLPSGQHPVEYLFSRLKDLDLDYPDGLVAVPEVIGGTAFFPGGYGLCREVAGQPPPMPLGEVMVLGQDFGKKKDYRKALSNGHELATSTTWRHLCPLLRDARISPKCCFFTNAYMGLRTGKSSTGSSPGTRTGKRGFRERCQAFLVEDQIAVQQPRLLLALGLQVAKFIAPLSPDLTAWRKAHSWRKLDAAGPVKHGVRFGDGPTPVSVVALLHPSFRRLNLAKDPEIRSWQGRTGDDAELAMLREAADTL